MDLKNLLPDSLRYTADQAAMYVLQHPENMEQMIQLSFSPDKHVGMRASRVVRLCYDQNPELLKPLMSSILDQLISTKNNSTIRNLLYLYVYDFKLLDEFRFGKLIEFCFKLLVNPSAEIAQRALAMQVLYNISCQIPDFKDELKAIIELHYEEGSAGLRCTADKILNKLSSI